MDYRPISKAIAGAVATMLVAWLARNDVVIDNAQVAGIVEFLISAAIGFAVVYLAPKNTEKR